MKRKFLIAASALLLSACASNGMRDGMVYRDGSWYSPASEGHGDYYTGVRHEHDEFYDWPWAWSVGYVPYGGYCPVRYRYCTSFWADSWYWPGYSPWGYQPWVVYQPRPRHRHHPDPDTPIAGQEPRPRPRDREPANRDAPRVRSAEPGVGSGRANGGEGRPRRRGLGGRNGNE